MMAQELEVNEAAIEEIGQDASIKQQTDDESSADPSEKLTDDDEAVPNEADTILQQQKDEEEAAENKKHDKLLRFYLPLHEAAFSGVWEGAEKFLRKHPDADITQVTLNKMTILHIGANMGHAVFIKKVLQSGLFPKEAMRLFDDNGSSVLHYAVSTRNLSLVKILDYEDTSLIQAMNNYDDNPLIQDATCYSDNKKVIWYLAKNIVKHNPPSDPGYFSGLKGAKLLGYLTTGYYYDVCLYLLSHYPQLANDLVDHWKVSFDTDLLHGLGRSLHFPSGSRLSFWERCIYHFIPIEAPISIRSDLGAADSQPQQIYTIRSNLDGVMHCIFGAISKAIVHIPSVKHIRDLKYRHKCITLLLEVACIAMSRWDTTDIVKYFKEREIHYEATMRGGTEIITALFKHVPHTMLDCTTQTDIVFWSIKYRQEHVFNLMMQKGATVTYFNMYVNDEAQENILHIAAKLAPYTRLTSVSSPALQMQRELQWFQAVDKIVAPAMKTNVNKDGHHPRALFTIEHKDLVKDAEIWLKDTSNSCLVVATLIITVVFAAAFTIPGGNIDGTGTPLLLRRSDFLVFIVSDAIGMFSSATSILMFLSILTARYAEDDFLRALPKRLILGLVSLLIALASMTISFGAALYIILHPKFNWIIVPIIGLTCIPVGLFIMLQLPLVIYMVRSTYGPSLLKVR